jgi:antitoxin component YwqK of YwqJK toxin-antitoxin module
MEPNQHKISEDGLKKLVKEKKKEEEGDSTIYKASKDKNKDNYTENDKTIEELKSQIQVLENQIESYKNTYERTPSSYKIIDVAPDGCCWIYILWGSTQLYYSKEERMRRQIPESPRELVYEIRHILKEDDLLSWRNPDRFNDNPIIRKKYGFVFYTPAYMFSIDPNTHNGCKWIRYQFVNGNHFQLVIPKRDINRDNIGDEYKDYMSWGSQNGPVYTKWKDDNENVNQTYQNEYDEYKKQSRLFFIDSGNDNHTMEIVGGNDNHTKSSKRKIDFDEENFKNEKTDEENIWCQARYKYRYEGEYSDTGERHGKGILYHNNGKKMYEGYWSCDIPHGKGLKYDRDGKTEYDGHYNQGKREGEGITYYENGNKLYKGIYQDDKHHGEGTSFHLNGRVEYNGSWFQGQEHGEGSLYNDGGDLLERGTWENGVFVKDLPSYTPTTSVFRRRE